MKKLIIGISLGIIICITYVFLNRKVTKEHLIKEFNLNKEVFNIVKDYCLSREQELFLSKESYDNLVEDECVNDFSKMFNSLGYKCIEKNGITVTFHHQSNKGEDMCIIYSPLIGTQYGMYSEGLGDDWYYYWIGYDMK